MSISTLESAASVRALDALYAEGDERKAVEAYYSEFCMREVMRGDLWQETTLSEKRLRYTPGCADRVLRRQLLTEFLVERLQDGLSTHDEPTLEEAIALLCHAARGRDIKEAATDLLARVATGFGKSEAEAA